MNIDYAGTWEEFPIIIAIGPLTDFTITHDQTGLLVGLEDYALAAGDSIVISLLYNRKSVILSSTGESLLGYISSDSSLGRFAIQPDPIVANGYNTFSVDLAGSTSETSIIILYKNRYIGI